MSPSGAEVLRQIKSRIDEIDPAAAREQSSHGAVLVDVRVTREENTYPMIPAGKAARDMVG